jgi:hypothetical protein
MLLKDVLTRPRLQNRLAAWDDYPVHQPDDPPDGWSERFYFNVQQPSGELVAIVGGGTYIGRGTSECYLCRLEGERQVNVRASQPVSGGGAAPFSFHAIEPMRRWQLQARVDGEPDFSAVFESRREPFFYEPLDIPASEPGGPSDFYRHFVGSGTIDCGQGPQPSARDRTWGVRTRRPRLHNWYVIHLEDAYLVLIHQEPADGSVHFSQAALCHDEGRVESLGVAGHELVFDAHDRQIVSGAVRLDGDERRLLLEYERVGQAIRLAGAGYDDRQGDRSETGAVQRDEYDLADPAVAARTGRGTMDAGVRARLSDGQWSSAGIGVVETAVARDHVTYGSALRSARG